MRGYNLLSLLLLYLLFFSCQKRDNEKDNYAFSVLTSSQTQIDFINQITSTPELNILNYLYFYNGAGICVADFNNDGLIDIFFAGNQTQNQLYINQGDLNFFNSTVESNIPQNDWTTGVTSIDINQDGLMDIYICQVTGINGKKTKNQLLVNQGINKDGIPVFKEMAAEYGLDISSYAQQAGFFDYDNDGDLDLFLLNHSLHPNRTYGEGKKRSTFHPLAGDKLFENQNGKFIDVTEKTNLFSSEIGYGLDFSFSDINNNGFVDIFVGNDFFENDYLYINQQNKSFEELISENSNALGHTTHFSMGNAIADINNNLRTDIFSVDMLPESFKEYKVSGTDFPYLTYQQYLKKNYAPQYMSNALHLNLGNTHFSEVANIKNIAASDWSWSALIADFDNNGYNDIFIANGILGATNDMDFINFISDRTYQNKINEGLKDEDLKLLDKLPNYKKKNKLFLNNSSTQFSDYFSDWSENPNTYSNGATYADLNNNGKLDIIVNNINDEVFIYKNESEGNYLKVKFEGNKPNRNGIGAKAIAFFKEQTLLRENFVNQGYMSSTLPEVHFGLGKTETLDSLWVIWPGGSYQSIKNIEANQYLTIYQENADSNFDYSFFEKPNIFKKLPSSSIPFQHHEFQTYEFSRNPLIPFSNGNSGPPICVADINEDGLEDIFLGNAKLQSSQLFIQQKDGSFHPDQTDLFEKHKKNEDVDAVFFDSNQNGAKDLLVISAGNEFSKGEVLQPRLYLNKNGSYMLKEDAFPQMNEQFSTIAIADVNNDGFDDIFLGASVHYETFGKSPKSYLLLNNQDNTFSDATLDYFETHEMGMITKAKFKDINNNNQQELFLVGYFMPIKLFELKENKFCEVAVKAFQKTDGLWSSLFFIDIDKDGFEDVLVGNFGENTKLKASIDEPIKLKINDFNENGTEESILTYYYNDKKVLFNTKDELASQIPSINKQFRSYLSFANATPREVLGNKWKTAETKNVFQLKSLFFKNRGDLEFDIIELPDEVNYSAVNAIQSLDITEDGEKELVLAGNRFDLNTQLGQLDANKGTILKYVNGKFTILEQHNLYLKGRVNSIEAINVKNKEWLIFGTNNDSLQIFQLQKNE